MPSITGCRFINNRAQNGGGGASFSYSIGTVRGCTFVGNQCVNGEGGGLESRMDSEVTVENTILPSMLPHTVEASAARGMAPPPSAAATSTGTLEATGSAAY